MNYKTNLKHKNDLDVIISHKNEDIIYKTQLTFRAGDYVITYKDKEYIGMDSEQCIKNFVRQMINEI